MNTLKRKSIVTIVIISLTLIAGLTALIFYPNHYVLTFQNQRTNELLSYIPVHEHDIVELRYTHSVHLSEVRELYRVKEGMMKPEKLIYEDTAIGMPSDAHGGDTFRTEDGKYIIEKSKDAKAFPYINLSVGQVRAKHKIIYQDQKLLLKEFVGAGTNIQIDAKHLSRWQLWEGVNMLE
ncbi:DUF1850 domain-containing protein [Pontibacillus marinus]|uniref:RocC n=1 Tax=Pontibacillus marinus BH030004 = DSM 16465 TaxID=1385511 RepID=A0A0A5HP70_9BACI|nr:DUF1850 domain-containing protein [Pontibacillus marinus]KGX85417.1 RocC [Pontibacillus marinus BH030004 = DSM 16465]